MLLISKFCRRKFFMSVGAICFFYITAGSYRFKKCEILFRRNVVTEINRPHQSIIFICPGEMMKEQNSFAKPGSSYFKTGFIIRKRIGPEIPVIDLIIRRIFIVLAIVKNSRKQIVCFCRKGVFKLFVRRFVAVKYFFRIEV